MPVNSASSDLRNDPRWQAVERILSTAPFQKSANLHGLLSYLAELTIQGKTEALTERQIGIAVFGKPADYSPAEDSAVRVQVRQLRLRVHEYFSKEGRSESQHVEIPKGSYVLEFKASHVEPAAAAPLPPAPPDERRAPRRGLLREILFWTAIGVAAVCAFGWYSASRTGNAGGVPWPLNAVIQKGRQTTVVLSDANLSTLRLLNPHEISLDDYLQPGFREGLVPPGLNGNVAHMLTYLAHSQLTSFADAAVLTAISKTAGANRDQISPVTARDVDQRDLEKGNYKLYVCRQRRLQSLGLAFC